MPLLVLVILALVTALGAALIAYRHPQLGRPLLLLVVGGGLVLGVLAVVIRADADAIGRDVLAANWGERHATDFSTDLRDAFTRLGQPGTIAAFATVLAIVETIRRRSPWPALFMVALAALAAGLAVAIAASRVLLDVHWLSDVAAGLALGWAWFALCAIAVRRRWMARVRRRREPGVFSRA